MASINSILIKRNNLSGTEPNVSDLTLGELALNTADGKLFIRTETADLTSISTFLNSNDLPYVLNESLSSINTQHGGNTVSQVFGVVLGGYNNDNSGGGSTVVNGENNDIDGDFSTILNGIDNKIELTGDYSAIIGGQNNLIAHENSFIIGSNISSHANDFTYVNNISAQGVLYGDGSGLTNLAAAAPAPDTGVRALTANWQLTYTTVQNNSATNWDNNLANQYTHTNFLPLSGGTLTGTFINDVSATGSFYGDGSKLTGIVAGDTVATTPIDYNYSSIIVGPYYFVLERVGTLNSKPYYRFYYSGNNGPELVEVYWFPSGPGWLFFWAGDGETETYISTGDTQYPWQSTWGSGYSVSPKVSDLQAQPLQLTSSYGSSISAARADHVHPYPTALQLSAVSLTEFKSLSSNWQSSYTTVQSNSATNWDNNLANQYTHTNFLPLSGGTLTGTIAGDLSATGSFYGDGSNLTGIVAGDTVATTLVRSNSANWNSSYTTVQSNSATIWNYQGTDLKNLSSGWVGGNIAYTNLVSNSAAYLSAVDLSFLSVSANWDSAFTSVNSNSANWQNTYTSYAANSASFFNIVLTLDPLKFVFIGDSTTKNFTVSGTSNSTNASVLEVLVDSVRQEPTLSYTLSADIVRFITAPSLNSRIVIITPNNTTSQLNVIKKHDFVQQNTYSISYAGIASLGVLDSSPSWRITKTTFTDNGSVSATGYKYDSAWSDRLILNYNY